VDTGLNTQRLRHTFISNQLKRILLGSVCILALGLAATGSSPAAAKAKLKKEREKEHVTKLPFGDIPKGPLEIFVSINQQKLHFYSAGVHVADEPVATGVPGHLTPLGVFSVIQRDRYHHSNIYDNAPMPFMERITWSGVALHQGVGLGHQASHGCIRMPGDFAAKLWQLPTMGMRVIIAHPELRPTEFADPHLFVHKAPAPVAAVTPAVRTAQTTDPGTKTDVVDPPGVAPGAASPAPAEKPAESHPDAMPAAPQQPSPQAKADPAAPAVTQPNNTAELLGGMMKAAEANATQPSEPSAAAPAETAQAAAPAAAQPEPAAPAAASTPAAPAPAAAQTTPAASAAPATASTPETPAPAAVQTATPAPAQAATAAPAKPATPETSAPAAAQTTTPAPAEAATAAPAADITAPISLDDVPLPPTKPVQIGRGEGGPIAVFISRKTGRIYVRQDFTPVFDAPVKIDNPNEPIGTHVFTAIDYLPDHSTFRWTVTTLPGEPPRAEEHWKTVTDRYGNRHRVRVEERTAAPVDPQPPETPQQALARIEIPQDVLDQIQQLIVPGSSLIISDQGLGSETGEYTDFIVVTR
jgi:hypothetical protein